MTERISARVLLVDDDRALLRTWTSVLEAAGHRVVAASSPAAARTALEAAAARGVPIDIVLLDLQLGPQRGEDCIPEIAQLQPQATIAVVSAYLDASTVVELVPHCRVSVPKPVDSESLLLLVEELACARVSKPVRLSAFASGAGLSDREADVVRHSLDGKTIKETAAAMGCQPGTIYTYWKRILKKTRLRSQREVIEAVARLEVAG